MEKSWRRWQGRKGHRKGARERELHGGNTKKIHNDIETRSEVCNKTRKRRGKERISKMVGEKKESGKMEGELIRIGVDSKSRDGGKRFGRERWHRGETAVEKWPRHKGRMREYVPLSRILKRATYPRFSTVCPFSSSF